jgi:hypothetical protein
MGVLPMLLQAVFGNALAGVVHDRWATPLAKNIDYFVLVAQPGKITEIFA